MVNDSQPLSAFAVYSLKRKKEVELSKSKKAKRAYKGPDVTAPNNTIDTEKKNKQHYNGKLCENNSKLNLSHKKEINISKTKNADVKDIRKAKKTLVKLNHSLLNNKCSNKQIKGKVNKLQRNSEIPPTNNVTNLPKKKGSKKLSRSENENTQVSDLESCDNNIGASSGKSSFDNVTVISTKPKQRIKKKTQKKKAVNTQQIRNLKKVSQDLKNTGTHSNLVHLSRPINEQDDSHIDPVNESKRLFEWLIHPLKADDFFQKHWEKTPLQIKRNKRNYYKLLMSTVILDEILRKNYILFDKNIDITSYTDGVRETHNPVGRALPSIVWDYYINGCSVRMLNPQTFIPKLHALNATLQEYFGCFVGANSYLTPPDSQGFAPHYDDIEAFILQIEGKKRWRLYRPRHNNEYLPRYSSKNFDQSEIGDPIMDTILNAGELLYFPRGTIHQGETIDGAHSLHITLSVYQMNSYGDLLEKLLPAMLKHSIENNSQFREGLPLGYLRHSGYAHSENQSEEKKSFSENIRSLLQQMIDKMDIDAAVDQMAKKHIHDFLPPVLTSQEQECSVITDGERMVSEGKVVNRVEIEPDTKIRLARSHCARLVSEEGVFRIYYSTENSKEYHEYELQFLEVNEEFVDAVKEIILHYPNFIRVEDLPIQEEDMKIQLVKDLWEKCVIITEEPLDVLDE